MTSFVPQTQTLGARKTACRVPASYICRQGKALPTLRVHVVGCPRSGTTLMAELLNHAYSFGGEIRHECSLFDPVRRPSYPYLSKSASDTHRIQRAFNVDSELFVIAMVRDPRSVVASKHGSTESGDYLVGFDRWRQAMESVTALDPQVRCLQVRYESLIKDPVGVQRQIEARFKFLRRKQCFASFAPEASEVLENSVAALDGVAGFESGRITAWRDHLPRVRSELDAHPDFAKWLVELGYEDNDNWRRQLDDVESVGPTTRPLANDAFKNIGVNLRYWWRARRYLMERTRLGAISTVR